MNKYTATQGASVCRFASPRGGENSPSVGDGLTIVTYKCTYPGGIGKQETGKRACKHTLDRVPNHATVRIRQIQEGEQENA